MEARAAELLALDAPQVGMGGEIVPTGDVARDLPGIVETVECPDAVTAEASLQRLDMAGDARCMTLAADTAETIGAGNSLEKMLAHQAASAHQLAMRMTATANKWLDAGTPTLGSFGKGEVTAMQEAQRAANAAARLMRSFDDHMETLRKLRSGGEQRVTVIHQHVQVAGGNVAVAGSVSRGQGGGENEKQ
ncbi:hypothetical protein C882_3521 [Caenispirillum salinarum AK4]|uniref:Uncharacterized protein n=1 Tax=Caenispirillum salinarum AK4 TaxID=1238182 RepID=K9H0J7_9PROT|nr:hypothetical protein [Caenispirillum salinarum]EKV31770.1 hypothetical protein C882_3521 [Caenispirillum salinarum AK4]